MAAGAFISALANLPWGQVVDNAPKLAEAAARLLRAASGLRKPAAPAAHASTSPTAAPPSELQILQSEVAVLRATLADVQEQMQVTSQLLTDLTQQNLQLIGRVELNRRRWWWLTTLGVGLLLMSLAVTIYLRVHGT